MGYGNSSSRTNPTSDDPPTDESQQPSSQYNYDEFQYRYYDDSHLSRGIEAGDEAFDCILTQLDGAAVHLSDLWADQPIVVEFGSISCPIFVERIERMNDLMSRYDDEVKFFVVYVREAHPGEQIRPHRSMEEKLACARRVQEQEDINRTVLIDDIEGTMHRAYAPLPNAAYVIGTDGVVAHSADWVEPARLDGVLDELLAANGEGARVEKSTLRENFASPTPRTLWTAYRVTRRAGWQSLRDFVVELPKMMVARMRQQLSG